MTATNLAKLDLRHRDSAVKLKTEGARANISIRFQSICGGNPVLPCVFSPCSIISFPHTWLQYLASACLLMFLSCILGCCYGVVVLSPTSESARPSTGFFSCCFRFSGNNRCKLPSFLVYMPIFTSLFADTNGEQSIIALSLSLF